MKLYLMRHGEALHPSIDPEMHLSPRGRAEVVKMAGYLKRPEAAIDAIWHSPKARAVETAQTVAEVMGFDPKRLHTQVDLVPEAGAEAAKARIEAAQQSGVRGLLIISHMPFLPKLTAALAGPSNQTDFETAGAACFTWKNGLWEREWSSAPARL